MVVVDSPLGVALASFAFRTRVAKSGEEAVPGDRNIDFRLITLGFIPSCSSSPLSETSYRGTHHGYPSSSQS